MTHRRLWLAEMARSVARLALWRLAGVRLRLRLFVVLQGSPSSVLCLIAANPLL